VSSDRTATATANGYSHSRHTSGALVKMRGLHSRGRRGRSWTGRLRLWHRLRPRRSEPECWFLPTPQRWSRQKRIVPTAPNRFGPPLNSFQGIPTPGLRQKRNRGVNGDASATVNGRVCGEWGPRRNRRNPPGNREDVLVCPKPDHPDQSSHRIDGKRSATTCDACDACDGCDGFIGRRRQVARSKRRKRRKPPPTDPDRYWMLRCEIGY
jgi:hypothetical protein